MLEKMGSVRSFGGRAMKLAAALMLGSALSVVAVTPAYAQESQASLRGTITGGATQVAAIEVATGVRRSVEVGSDGSYNFASLRPGTYRLDVTANGRTRSTDTFTLSVAQNAQLDFNAADVSPVVTGVARDGEEAGVAASDTSSIPSTQDIIVVGRRIVTNEGGEVGTDISQRLIEQLPQNNRNFLAFADLAPGV